MPRMDRTGPNGQGPMTGRGLGDCVNSSFNDSYVSRIGRGIGYGLGFRRGRGLGIGSMLRFGRNPRGFGIRRGFRRFF